MRLQLFDQFTINADQLLFCLLIEIEYELLQNLHFLRFLFVELVVLKTNKKKASFVGAALTNDVTYQLLSLFDTFLSLHFFARRPLGVIFQILFVQNFANLLPAGVLLIITAVRRVLDASSLLLLRWLLLFGIRFSVRLVVGRLFRLLSHLPLFRRYHVTVTAAAVREFDIGVDILFTLAPIGFVIVG